MTERKLTPKQERFVEEYLIDLNATQAATRAGYSAKTAEQQGYQLLQKPSVQAALEERRAKMAKATDVTPERVIHELAKLGFANMADYMRAGPDGDPYLDFSNLTRDQAAALVEVTVEDFKDGRGDDARDVRKVKFKLADKRAALVDIGKHLGLFVERVKHEGLDTTLDELDREELKALARAIANADSGAEGSGDSKAGGKPTGGLSTVH